MIENSRKRVSKWDLKELPEISLVDEYNDAWSAEVSNKDGRESSETTEMSPGLDDWRLQKRNCSPNSGCGRSYSCQSRSRSRSRSPNHGLKRELGPSDRSIRTRTHKDFIASRSRRSDHFPYPLQDDKNTEEKRYFEGCLMESWEGRQRKDGTFKYSNSDGTKEQAFRVEGSNNLCSDFFKGKCHKGSSCKYNHHNNAAYGNGIRSTDKVFSGRENDQRYKRESFELMWNDEPNRRGNIPCKYFAAGNCRNGKFCRFSHHCQNGDSPSRRFGDDWRRRQSNNLNDVDQLDEGLKRGETSLSIDEELPEWNDDRNGSCAPEQRATILSVDDRWKHICGDENRSRFNPTFIDTTVEGCEKEYPQLRTGDTGSGFAVNGYRVANDPYGDMKISSAWSHSLPQLASCITKEERGHVTQTSQPLILDKTILSTCQQDKAQVSQMHHIIAAMQPKISENSILKSNSNLDELMIGTFSCEDKKETGDTSMSYIDLNFSASAPPRLILEQNYQSSSGATQHSAGFKNVEQLQQTSASYTSRGENIVLSQNQPFFQESKSFDRPNVRDPNKSEVISKNPPSHCTASRDQLSYLTNISASLARLLEDRKQLPQTYAAMNASDAMETMLLSLSNSIAPVVSNAIATIRPDSAIGSQEKYDPFGHSIETDKSDTRNPPGLVSNSIEEKRIAGQKLEIPSQILFHSSVTDGQSGDDLHTPHSPEDNHTSKNQQLKEPGHVADGKGEETNGNMAKESEKKQEDGPLEKTDADDMDNESKKNNGGKVFRAFKFALVECVKELLRPTWKDGQLSKEAHKTIVKKVVDKVTGSIQGVHIPRSQEKIDSYLTSSKPKLSKLVQAYVNKHQKS